MSVAKLRLSDFEKSQRQAAESLADARQGRLVFGEALKILRTRIQGDASLKPRSRGYYEQRIVALLKSWAALEQRDVRTLSKSDCLDWGAKFARQTCPSAFNNTVAVLRRAFDVVVELGVRYDNPATAVKRLSVRPKKLALPGFAQFNQFVETMQSAGGRDSRHCADLVRFLAYGGFRLGEARNVTWADCDFVRSEITVRGEADTGTKNSEVRKIPMIADMQFLLNRLRQERSTDASAAPVMQVKECQKAMDRAAKLVGIARITHHDLRQYAALLIMPSWTVRSCESPANRAL